MILAIAPVLAWWLERSVSLISGTALPTLEPSLPVTFPAWRGRISSVARLWWP